VKFLVDAQLPFALCILLRDRGLDAIHTRELPAQNATSDTAINDLSIKESRIVISKDTDFYYSHLLYHKPFKLLLIRTGNLGTKDLKILFERNLDFILEMLLNNTLVELNHGSIRVVA
jgi:predicted nuclease of predicted toxin-antitoxin system